MPNTFGINSWLTRASILTFPLPNVMLEINVPFLRVIYAAIAVGCVGSLYLLSAGGLTCLLEVTFPNQAWVRIYIYTLDTEIC